MSVGMALQLAVPLFAAGLTLKMKWRYRKYGGCCFARVGVDR